MLLLAFFSDFVDHIEKRQAFRTFLEDSGLDASLLVKAFAEEGILTVEHCHGIRGNFEKFQKLTRGLNDVGTFAVQEMLDIPPEVVAEHEFKSILDKIGLDSKYWFAIFKNQLGISHPLMFEYTSSLDCQILQTHVRHENELSVINQQFLTGNNQASSEIWMNGNENSRKYFVGIQKNLQELKVLLAERPGSSGSQESKAPVRKESVHDLAIRLKEENIRILLHIPRKELTRLGISTAGILEMFEQRIEELKQQIISDADVLDQHVIEKASDGLMHKGMYFMTNDEEKLIPRKNVLISPPDLCLSEPIMHHRNITEQFSSRKSQEFFSRSVIKNGYSLAVSERIQNSTQCK